MSFLGQEFLQLLLAIALLLLTARWFGRLALFLRLPKVVGELLAGVILGPTLLSANVPAIYNVLHFSGLTRSIFENIVLVAVVLFMFLAGMEIALESVKKYFRAALFVSLGGMLIPFVLGYLIGPSLYSAGQGPQAHSEKVFAIFFATALAISALPVIVKTLLDLNLLKTHLGTIVLTSAALNDVVGWLIFSVLLTHINSLNNLAAVNDVLSTVELPLSSYWWVKSLLSLGFVLFAIIFWRPAMKRVLQKTSQLSLAGLWCLLLLLVSCTLGAFLTAEIGVHALFGAFVMGVSIGDLLSLPEGDSRGKHERMHKRLTWLSQNFLTPLFFASVGLKADFYSHAKWPLIAIVCVVACLGKIIGSGIGARLSKLSWRDSGVIAFALNSRGAMEIVFSLMALQIGLINADFFVALTCMALFTSALSGPVMQAIYKPT